VAQRLASTVRLIRDDPPLCGQPLAVWAGVASLSSETASASALLAEADAAALRLTPSPVAEAALS
jgi:hypothetical protein